MLVNYLKNLDKNNNVSLKNVFGKAKNFFECKRKTQWNWSKNFKLSLYKKLISASIQLKS